MLALRRIARKSKLTREATYRMLSKSGNPELRSLTAILGAAGLRLSVKPIEQRPRRKQAADSLLSIAGRVAAAGIPPMSMVEINAEVKATRAERKQRAGGH